MYLLLIIQIYVNQDGIISFNYTCRMQSEIYLIMIFCFVLLFILVS